MFFLSVFIMFCFPFTHQRVRVTTGLQVNGAVDCEAQVRYMFLVPASLVYLIQ